MAHGFLNPTDLRKERNFTGAIVSGIGKRIGKASDMARKERAYASKKAKEQDTTLKDEGMGGRGYFFQRALGSTFGGDRVARTRGRFETDPPEGRDPSKTQQGRFRGGFNYDFSTGGALARVTSPEESPIEPVNVSVMDDDPSGGGAPALSPGFVSLGGAVQTALSAGSDVINPEILPPEPGPGLGGGSVAGSLGQSAIDVNATEIKDVVRALKFVELKIDSSAQKTVSAIQSSAATNADGLRRLGSLNAALAKQQMQHQTQMLQQQMMLQQQLADRQQAQLEAAKTFGKDKSWDTDPEDGPQDEEKKGGGLGGLLKGLLGPLGGLGNMLGGGLDLMGGRYMRRSPGVGRQVGARRRLGGMRAGRARRGIGGLLGRGKGLIGRGLGRVAGKGALKGLGKGLGKAALKKIPVAGLLAGALFAGQRAMAGDWAGAGLELASGGASLIPGVGTAASVGLDAALMARDMSMPQMAAGGITDGPKSGYPVMKHGKELTFSAEGPEAKKIFKAMGGGYLDAQLERKKDVAEIGVAANSKGTPGGSGRAWWDFLGWAGTGNDDKPAWKDAAETSAANLSSMSWNMGGGVNTTPASDAAAPSTRSPNRFQRRSRGENAGMGRAVFGETGRVFNAEGYVHGHFQTNDGTKQDVVNDVLPVIKQLLASGVTDVSISSGDTFTKDMDDAQIRALIEKGMSQHTHSGDGRSVDIFVPKGTPVPFPLTDVRNASGGREGRSGILPGTGKVWVGHLTPDSKSGMNPSATQEPSVEPAAETPSVTPVSAVPPTTPDPLAASAAVQQSSANGDNAKLAAIMSSFQQSMGALQQSQAMQPQSPGMAFSLASTGLGGTGTAPYLNTLGIQSLK